MKLSDQPRIEGRPFQMPKPKRDWSTSAPTGRGIRGLSSLEEHAVPRPLLREREAQEHPRVNEDFHSSFDAAEPQIASNSKEQTSETSMESARARNSNVQMPISHEKSTTLMTSKHAGASSTNTWHCWIYLKNLILPAIVAVLMWKLMRSSFHCRSQPLFSTKSVFVTLKMSNVDTDHIVRNMTYISTPPILEMVRNLTMVLDRGSSQSATLEHHINTGLSPAVERAMSTGKCSDLRVVGFLIRERVLGHARQVVTSLQNATNLQDALHSIIGYHSNAIGIAKRELEQERPFSFFKDLRNGELPIWAKGADKIDQHQRSENWLEVLHFIDTKIRHDDLSIEPEIWRLESFVTHMSTLEDQIATCCLESQDRTHLVEDVSLHAIEDLYYHAIQALVGNEEELRNFWNCHRRRFQHEAPNPSSL